MEDTAKAPVRDGIGVPADGIAADAFLMIGQSNMAGRGDIGSVPPIEHPDLLMLRNGRWQKLSEPVNPDRGIFSGKYRSGISLAASFALCNTVLTGRRTGLIPCADGGTKLDQWMPGEVLYENAVMCTRFALRNAVLRGILWHQGEADVVKPEKVAEYGEKFKRMITSLRADLGCGDVPVLIGELGGYLVEKRGWTLVPELNAVFAAAAADLPACAVVSADGLCCRPDNLHFDAPSLRIFGERYYEKYRELSGI